MEQMESADATLDMVASFAERGLLALAEFSRCQPKGTEPQADIDDAMSVCRFGEHLAKFLSSDDVATASQRAFTPQLAGTAYFHGGTVPRLVFVGREHFSEPAKAAQVLCDAGQRITPFYQHQAATVDASTRAVVDEARQLCVDFLRNTRLAA